MLSRAAHTGCSCGHKRFARPPTPLAHATEAGNVGLLRDQVRDQVGRHAKGTETRRASDGTNSLPDSDRQQRSGSCGEFCPHPATGSCGNSQGQDEGRRPLAVCVLETHCCFSMVGRKRLLREGAMLCLGPWPTVSSVFLDGHPTL